MVIERTNFRSKLEGNEVEFTSQQELESLRAQRAEAQALAQAGVTQSSGFADAAPAPVAAPEPPPAPVVDPSTPTVRASQLANGTASLAEPTTAAPEAPQFPTPADPNDLAAIISGKGGTTPLTREQVVATVTAAVPEAAALIAQGVTDASLANAFSQVLAARDTVGTKPVHIDLVGFETKSEMQNMGEYEMPVDVTVPSSTPTGFNATVTVGAGGEVNGKALAADIATVADYKPYPDGNSADHVKAQFDVVGDPGDLASLTAAHGDQPALPRQAVIDTVLEAAPEARALIAAGVTDDSLARAFSQVIEARKTPGEKTLSLDLVALETKTEQSGWGEYATEVTTIVPAAKPTTFSAKMSVSEGGLVNGARLSADIATQITSAARNVPQEFKDTTLKEVGLSDEWLGNATQEQKDYALAKIISAKDTPGAKQLDFSYGYSVVQYSSENPVPTNLVAAGVVNLNVSADGKVNGKPLTAEIAFNATRTIEAMPAAVRRATLMSLSFSEDAINKASPEQEKYALIKTSVATATPGEAHFEVHMGGDKYAVGLKIGQDGSIDGAGVALVPPPPKKSWWKTVVSVVLTVVSIVYPPVAIICQAIQAGMAIASGAKGLALVGAIAGAAAGFADVAGYASMATTLSNVATTVGTVNSAINAFKSGDFLGALSSAASLAGGFAGGNVGETLSTIGTVAAGARALKNGDVAGAIGAGLNVASGMTGGEAGKTLATLGQVANTVSAAASGNIELALTGVLDLAGMRGILVPKTEAPAPVVTPVVTSTEPTVVNGVLGTGNGLTLASLTQPTTFGLGFDLGNFGNTLGYAFDGNIGGALGSVLETEQGPIATQAEVRRVDNAIPSPTSRVVASGDTLSKIAAEMMGDANRWPELYAYNIKTLGGTSANANSIRVGAELLIPPPEFELPGSIRNALHNAAHIEPPSPPKPVVAEPGLQVIDAPAGFNFNLGRAATSFASGSAGFDMPGTTLGGTALGAIVDQSIAYGNSLPKAALPKGSDSWAGYAKQFGSNMVNTLANTVLLANDAVASFIPGTASNQVVTQAIVDFGKKVGEIATTVYNDNGAGAAKAIEKAIGHAVFTVMDPRQWGEGGTKLFETVISATFGGTAKLAETMNRDPGAIEPGKLMLDAMGAAFGLSNLLLVGAAKTAVVGAVDTVTTGVKLGLEGKAVAGVVDTSIHVPTYGLNVPLPVTPAVDALIGRSVTDTAGYVDELIAARPPIDQTLKASFDSARANADRLRLVDGDGGSANMHGNYRSVTIGKDVVDYTRLPDGFEIIGLDGALPRVASHEVDIHLANMQAGQRNAYMPYNMAIREDANLHPAYFKYASLDEIEAYNRSASVGRAIYLDAVGVGDTAAAQSALSGIGADIDFSQTMLRRYDEVYRAANTADSQALIGQTLRNAGPARTIGVRGVEFEIVSADGSLVTLTTAVPAEATAQEAADYVRAQLRQTMTTLDQGRKDLTVLQADYDGLMVHAQARGIVPSMVPPAPTVAPPVSFDDLMRSFDTPDGASAGLGRGRGSNPAVDRNDVWAPAQGGQQVIPVRVQPEPTTQLTPWELRAAHNLKQNGGTGNDGLTFDPADIREQIKSEGIGSEAKRDQIRRDRRRKLNQDEP